jgi:hypothetical protein
MDAVQRIAQVKRPGPEWVLRSGSDRTRHSHFPLNIFRRKSLRIFALGRYCFYALPLIVELANRDRVTNCMPRFLYEI